LRRFAHLGIVVKKLHHFYSAALGALFGFPLLQRWHWIVHTSGLACSDTVMIVLLSRLNAAGRSKVIADAKTISNARPPIQG